MKKKKKKKPWAFLLHLESIVSVRLGRLFPAVDKGINTGAHISSTSSHGHASHGGERVFGKRPKMEAED